MQLIRLPSNLYHVKRRALLNHITRAGDALSLGDMVRCHTFLRYAATLLHYGNESTRERYQKVLDHYNDCSHSPIRVS